MKTEMLGPKPASGATASAALDGLAPDNLNSRVRHVSPRHGRMKPNRCSCLSTLRTT